MNVPVNQLPPPRWDLYRGSTRSYAGQTAAASFDQPDDVEWADYAKSIMGGGASLVQATGWLANVLGAEDIGSSIETLGSNAVDFWNDSLSDPAKAEIAKEIIHKNDITGEYEWGDPSFSTIGLMGAQSLLGTAAGMGMGAGLTKVLQAFANPYGRQVLMNAVRAPIAQPGVVGAGISVAAKKAARGKLKLVDMVMGGAGFGVGEGFVGGISAGASVYDNIMSLDHEKLMANERYRQVYESTDNSISELERHQYAADTVAKEASSAAGWQSGLTTALLGAPMGAYFGRLLGGAKLSKTLTRGIATGASGEAAQEFLQSGVEQFISNVRTQPFDPSIDDFDGVLNAAVAGFLAGGLLGGLVGPASVGGARAEIAGDEAIAEGERTEIRAKLGGELQTAATKAAEAGVDETVIMEIVHDAVEQRVEIEAAIENIEALAKEKETGEEPTARAAPPAIPEEAERKPLAPAELSDMLEKASEGPVEVETVNPTTLQVDAELFQFKQQTDEQGVTGALKGVPKFEQIKAGLAIVWERKDGVRFIVDGHQRVNLAKQAVESGQDPATVRMTAVILREADGVTPEMARDMAALKNIAEGTGTPIDAAQVIRDMGPAADEAIANLPPNQALVKQGKGLAKLDEEAFGKAVNEVIEPAYAALVGDMIEDGPLQNAAIDVLQKTGPPNATQARAIIDQVRTTGTEEVITEDLFGETAVAESLYLERAQVLDAAQRTARRDKAIFKTLTKREGKITGTGKNVLDRAANVAKVSEADRALAILSAEANTKGPVSDALTEAARQVKQGKKPGAVAGAFLDQVVSSITGRGKAGPKAGKRKPKAKRPVEPAIADIVTGENLVAGEQGLYLVEQASAGRSPEVAPGEPVTTEAPTAETLFSRKAKTKPCGKCFENSGRYLMDNGAGDPDLVLVHGYVEGQGPIEGVRFAHAWIERKNADAIEGDLSQLAGKDQDLLGRTAMDLTTDDRLENPLEMPAVLYRSVGHAEVLFEYTHDELLKKLASSHHWGPWDFEETAEARALYSRKEQQDLFTLEEFAAEEEPEPTAAQLAAEEARPLTPEEEAYERRQDLAQEETRRDRIRNTGQPDLFSRPGIPLNQIRLPREVEIEGTGVIYDVEQNAEVMLRQHDKRINMVEELRTCIRG